MGSRHCLYESSTYKGTRNIIQKYNVWKYICTYSTVQVFDHIQRKKHKKIEKKRKKINNNNKNNKR